MNGVRTMFNRAMLFLMIPVVAGCTACGKTYDKSLDINPLHVAQLFFETWKNQDWKALYKLTDPSFMQMLRTRNLSPELQRLSDEELFVHEFKQVQERNPGMVLNSYLIKYITPYHKGDTTLWIYAVVNGKKKKIPMTLDGLAWKIDLARIQEFSDREYQPKNKEN